MKTHLIAIFFAFLIVFVCEAQTQQGSKMIGGNGSGGIGEVTGISLSPSFGYFVTHDLAVGSGIPLSYDYDKHVDYRTIGGGLEPYVRYYLGKEASTRIFAQANGSYFYLNTKNTGGAHYGSAYIGNSFGGSLGLVRFLTEQVGLETQLFYVNSQSVQTSDSQTSHHPRHDSYGLRFGLQVHLPRPTKK